MPTMTMSKEGFNMKKQRVEKKQGSDDISIHLKKKKPCRVAFKKL